MENKDNQIWSVEPKATIFEALKIMSDKEIHEYLVEKIGTNYHNYPECVKYYLRLLNYKQNKSVDILV